MNIALACALVSIIDFLGFNYVYYSLRLPPWRWHIIQFPMLFFTAVGLSYFGHQADGILFTFLHFGFVNDALFYIISLFLKAGSLWENRGTTLMWWRSNDIPHAKFSYIGWFGYRNPKALLIQAIICSLLVTAFKVFF